MLRFLMVRGVRAFVTILLVVTFAFVVLRMSGDPAQIIMGPDAPPEAIAAFRKNWGSMIRSGSNICAISALLRVAILGYRCAMANLQSHW